MTVNLQERKMSETIECQSGGQTWRFELQSRLTTLPGGARYLARDLSSRYLALDDPDSGLVIVELRRIDQPQARQRYLRSLENFQRLGCDSHLWRLHAAGVIQGGPFDGQVLVAGEHWTRLASSILPTTRWDADDSAVLYDRLTRALFWMHESGLAHGGLSADTVACIGDETAGNWKLLPAGPRPQQPVSMAEDVLALGKLVGRTLGIDTSVTMRDLRVPLSLSSDWRTILMGCLAADPNQRWTSGRALFGANLLPVAAPLTVIPGAGRFRVQWPEMGDLEVTLFELENGQPPVEPGTVRVPEVLNGFGRQISGQGHEANVLQPVEGRVFQTVTRVADVAVVFGGVVRLSSQADVTELEVTIDRGNLTASFKPWPAGAEVVQLALRYDRFAFSPEDAGRIVECTSREFHQAALVVAELDSDPREHLFVTAFAMRATATGWEHSPGASDGCRWTGPGFRHRVTYRIESIPAGNSKGGSSSYELVLVSPTRVKLPRLTLRGGQHSSSLRADRGVVVLDVPAGTVLKAKIEMRIGFTFAPSDGRSGWAAKLLPVDPAESRRVDLLSKNPEGERLG